MHPGNCPICGLPLLYQEDGFGTDRGYQDASYWECPVCGEVEDEE